MQLDANASCVPARDPSHPAALAAAARPVRALVAAGSAVVRILLRHDATAGARGVAGVALDAAGSGNTRCRAVADGRADLGARAAVRRVGVGVQAAAVARLKRRDAAEAAGGR